MKLQQLLSYTRKACEDYDMIQSGDKIAVGLSGGKDSISLLIALSNLKRFYPNHFELKAITVSLGIEGMDFSSLHKLCDELQVEFSLVETNIYDVVFTERVEKNPCSLCSKMRKGALDDEAKKLGCNKVALGHNKNDVIETFFMSLFYNGRIHTFSPVTYLDRKDIFSIRPLIYVSESEIIEFCKNLNVDIVKNNCPADGNTKRAEIKKFIREQTIVYKNFEEKVFGAITRTNNIKGWCEKK